MSASAPNDVLVVLTTAGSEEEAARIAHALVERRVAACVNVLPRVRSIYAWQGRICDEAEALLLTKTTRARLEELTAAIRELHSYDVPEIVALPADTVEGAYASWLVAAVAPERPDA